MLVNWLLQINRRFLMFALISSLMAAGMLTAYAIESTPSGDASIISPDAKLEKLFDGAHFTEGPAVSFDGMVYFSDITFTYESGMQAGHIWKFNPNTGETTVYRSPSGMSNGIKFDAQGRMIVAEGADYGGRRVTRTDMATGKSEIIAGLYEGRPFNAPNDITIDEKGRIYFSDPRYLGHEPVDQPVMGVYRIDPDGSIHLNITDAGKPNGVAVSLTRKRFTSSVTTTARPVSIGFPLARPRTRDEWHYWRMTWRRTEPQHFGKYWLITTRKMVRTAW